MSYCYTRENCTSDIVYSCLCNIESDDPWYVKEKELEESSNSKRRKISMDPINDMKQHLARKEICPNPHSTVKVHTIEVTADNIMQPCRVNSGQRQG